MPDRPPDLVFGLGSTYWNELLAWHVRHFYDVSCLDRRCKCLISKWANVLLQFVVSLGWILWYWDTNCSKSCVKRLKKSSATDHWFGCLASWTLIGEVKVCFLVLCKHSCVYISIISWAWCNILDLISVGFSLFRVVQALFLCEILVSCISKWWKSVIDYILLSITIVISADLIFLNSFFSNPIDPCFVFVSMFTVSVAVVGNIVVDRGFYEKVISILNKINLPLRVRPFGFLLSTWTLSLWGSLLVANALAKSLILSKPYYSYAPFSWALEFLRCVS